VLVIVGVGDERVVVHRYFFVDTQQAELLRYPVIYHEHAFFDPGERAGGQGVPRRLGADIQVAVHTEGAAPVMDAQGLKLLVTAAEEDLRPGVAAHVPAKTQQPGASFREPGLIGIVLGILDHVPEIGKGRRRKLYRAFQ